VLNLLKSHSLSTITGMGIELEVTPISTQPPAVVIVRTEDSSPAQLAGLKRGDIVVNMDGTDASGLSPEEVAALAR
jgi:C-terminal processing protease CtpA/Prc